MLQVRLHGRLCDPNRVTVVTDRDLLTALALAGLRARTGEEGAAVDPDVADEDSLLLVGEEPAAVHDQLNAGHCPRAEQRQRAGVRVALCPGLELRRVPATRIVVADQVAAVDQRVRRTPRECGRWAEIHEGVLAAEVDLEP